MAFQHSKQTFSIFMRLNIYVAFLTYVQNQRVLKDFFQNIFTANTFHNKFVTSETYLIKNLVHVCLPMR